MIETTTIHEIVATHMPKMLQNLSGILEKAGSHAQTKKVEIPTLLQTRLIADQFPLIKQIQVACDTAKLCGSRLSGKDAPKNPDTETTLGEVQERIASTVSYLQKFKPEDLKGYETKKIEFPWNPGKYLEGHDYFVNFVIPNFYFHYTTAYSILRANGVDVGKGDYLGHLDFKAK